MLASGVFVFFGIHNGLQEAIMKRPGFHFGWALGLLEMLGEPQQHRAAKSVHR